MPSRSVSKIGALSSSERGLLRIAITSFTGTAVSALITADPTLALLVMQYEKYPYYIALSKFFLT
jgi:hypothetical protein